MSVPCLSTCSSFQPLTAHRLRRALSSVSSITCLSLFLQVISFSLSCVCNHPFFVKDRWPQGHPEAQTLTLPPCSGHSPLEMLFLVYSASLNQQFLIFTGLKTPLRVKLTLTHILTALHVILFIMWVGVTQLHRCGNRGRKE